jgi:hypothetical protein
LELADLPPFLVANEGRGNARHAHVQHFDPHLLLNEIKRKCSRVFPFLRLRCKFLYGRFCGDMMNTAGHQIVVWRHNIARMAVDDHNSNQSLSFNGGCLRY